ncbi:MAG: hypothetical protein JNK48_07605 [Bryobacterales bacterium]|nr:hypothetical protein [Bryobacterales bacterium]
MVTNIDEKAKLAGFWSAMLAAVCAFVYDVAQLAEWQGWLGSHGGPESSSTPLGLILLLTPSLLLGPAYLMVTVSVHRIAEPAQRIWSHAAIAFATAYMVLTGTVYFVQLTWVAPRMAEGRVSGMEQFLFVPFDSFLYAVDILGYSLMSISTLWASFVFSKRREGTAARRLLLANGLLAPFIALQMFWHWLIWVASAWAITFPGAMVALAFVFRGLSPSEDPPPELKSPRFDFQPE